MQHLFSLLANQIMLELPSEIWHLRRLDICVCKSEKTIFGYWMFLHQCCFFPNSLYKREKSNICFITINHILIKKCFILYLCLFFNSQVQSWWWVLFQSSFTIRASWCGENNISTTCLQGKMKCNEGNGIEITKKEDKLCDDKVTSVQS